MMIKKQLGITFSIFTFCLFIGACGGGSGGATTSEVEASSSSSSSSSFSSTSSSSSSNSNSSGSSPTVLEGVFLDAAVQGLDYETTTQTGTTDENGTFLYLQGELVTFSVGNLILGAVEGKNTVFPIDLATPSDLTNPSVINITRLLQTLDEDRIPENGILITEAVRTAVSSAIIDFSLSVEDFENDGTVQTLVDDATALTSAGTSTLVSQEVAMSHMTENFLAQRGIEVNWADYFAFEELKRWNYKVNPHDESSSYDIYRYTYSRDYGFTTHYALCSSDNWGGSYADFISFDAEGNAHYHGFSFEGSVASISSTVFLPSIFPLNTEYPLVMVFEGGTSHEFTMTITRENLSTPYGSFEDALKVTRVRTSNASALTRWYVQGVGDVKTTETNSEGESTTYELTSIDILEDMSPVGVWRITYPENLDVEDSPAQYAIFLPDNTYYLFRVDAEKLGQGMWEYGNYTIDDRLINFTVVLENDSDTPGTNSGSLVFDFLGNNYAHLLPADFELDDNPGTTLFSRVHFGDGEITGWWKGEDDSLFLFNEEGSFIVIKPVSDLAETGVLTGSYTLAEGSITISVNYNIDGATFLGISSGSLTMPYYFSSETLTLGSGENSVELASID